MKIIVPFLFIAFSLSAGQAAEMIGAPLHSFRRQALENCWAVSGLQYFEAAVQARTGVSYSFAQDEAFWYEVFKQRLLMRWRKKVELGSGLKDDNIFTDFGIPETVSEIILSKKLKFYKILNGQVRIPGSEQLRLTPFEQSGNGFKRLRFKSEFKEILLAAPSESEALIVIDQFLSSSGLRPGDDSFRVGKIQYSRTAVADSLLEIPQISDALDLVWVPIQGRTASAPYRIIQTDMGVFVLSEGVTEKVAKELALKMWESKLPVLVSGMGHSWLIIAKDKNSDLHYVADSKNEVMKRDYWPFASASAIHVPRKILEKHFQIQP